LSERAGSEDRLELSPEIHSLAPALWQRCGVGEKLSELRVIAERTRRVHIEARMSAFDGHSEILRSVRALPLVTGTDVGGGMV
jgi:hypothetical protein